jgi:peptidoglycan/LPS O-acetylase OafA/YrhL
LVTIGRAFDPRCNALNAIRLGLALLVIVWHSFPLTGTALAIAPVRQLLGNVSVDGFFAISGFLITSSWLRRPEWRTFVWARLLRIMPAFWVALILTAALIAPAATYLTAGRLPAGFWTGAARYLLDNSALYVGRYDIAGTPLGVPYPHVWNGSAWTLFWEALCYVGVLALGVLGLLRRRGVAVVAFALALAGLLAVTLGVVDNGWVRDASRFATMFLAGVLVQRFQDRIPVRRVWVLAAAVLVAASAFLPDYRLVAALPLAYLLVVLGAWGTSARLRFPNDLSYGVYIYAFPLQQTLASAHLWRAGPLVFMVASIALTVPVAAASWFFVERPALRLKRRATSTVQEVAVLARTGSAV